MSSCLRADGPGQRLVGVMFGPGSRERRLAKSTFMAGPRDGATEQDDHAVIGRIVDPR